MKFLTKLLITFIVWIIWFFAFSEASQFYAYSKLSPKNINIPSYAPTWTTYYTDLSTLNLNWFTWTIKVFIQSSYNCSPWNILVKNWDVYTRYSMVYDSVYKICASPEINIDWWNNLHFFYATTQKITNTFYDIQLQFLDINSFYTSIIPFNTNINSSVSIPTTCPTIDSEYCINNNLCPQCPHIDKNYCMSEYWLIDPNSCPVIWDCPEDWFSRFVINWIDQDQSLLYNVNIPDYLSYDYIHHSNQISDLNIEWYNEDQDYINWIIDTQNYKPTSEDFTSVFMNIIPYMKIIIFILFLILVWKMLKKVFK